MCLQLIKIFTLRPFTRILKWGRDLKGVFNYLKINQMESFGLIRRAKFSKKEKHNKPEARKSKSTDSPANMEFDLDEVPYL